MTSWADQYAIHNVLTMNPIMPSPMMPPNFMVQENNTMHVASMKPPPLIGPILPDGLNQVDTSQVPIIETEIQSVEIESSSQSLKQQSRDRDRGRRSKNKDRRDRDRDRRHRSRSRDRSERSNRNDRDDRRRPTKWDRTRDRSNSRHETMPVMPSISGPNVLIPGNMLAHNMMAQHQMDMNIHHNMVPGMNMIPNMAPNVMDQNMMMMNQPIVISNQPIIFSEGILLPPIPGTLVPPRREHPKGCQTVVVGGLPNGVTAEVVIEIFKRFGEIIHVKSPRHGIFHIRFASSDIMEQVFYFSGYRFKFHDQLDNEATTMYIDYAMNREDEAEYERKQRNRGPTPPRVEPFTANALTAITEKIKSEEEFATSAPTLAVWLERGECNKKNANIFYSLIQASNNQLRRLFNEKMQLDEEWQNVKSSLKERFARILTQFEQVAKILSAAKHQRVSDHFTKQQRRNVEMWLKMTEEVENIKEEFKTVFEEDDGERICPGKSLVSQEKYDELKIENENLTYEMEGYKNEAYLAKDEAERKFEKFKAHFIAQQAMQIQKVYPPLPSTRSENVVPQTTKPKPLPPPTMADDNRVIISGPSVLPSEAKLISMLTAFLIVHPLGATLDYLVSYVRSMTPNVTQATVLQTLQKFTDVFRCKTYGVSATIEHRWIFMTFNTITNGG